MIVDENYCESPYAENDNTSSDAKAKIREINDAFRKTLKGGRIVVTRGVQELFMDNMPELFAAVSAFGDFSKDNDPFEEHDFGAFNFRGHKLFWKIEYFDMDKSDPDGIGLEFASTNPADPDVTDRVLTILLADER
jgi:hypothetical protein